MHHGRKNISGQTFKYYEVDVCVNCHNIVMYDIVTPNISTEH